MVRLTFRRAGLALMLAAGFGAGTANAQVFGTFAWQMQPYCNVVTLTITQFPAGYTVDGNDNQCGSGTLAAATGQVHINPNGTVGVNFAIITTPTGKAVHVAALLSPANGSGTWTDSVGNSGTFALGANTPSLPVRPFPASGLGASIITTTEIAAGAVGGSDINTAEVQARVSGTCPAGQAVSGVNANGTVSCQSILDLAGAFKRATWGFVFVQTTAVSFATASNAATLTFTSPIDGTALVFGRGYCNVTSDTASTQSVVLGTALAGETSINSFSDWVAVKIGPQASTTNYQLPFTTERALTVAANAVTTVTLKAYRESGAASLNCIGSYRVEIHPSVLP